MHSALHTPPLPHLGICGEVLHNPPTQPAAVAVFQRLGQVPVVKRHLQRAKSGEAACVWGGGWVGEGYPC